MTSSLKFEVNIRRDRKDGTFEYLIPALGIDKGGFSTLGLALDAATEQINGFFNGIIQNAEGKTLRMDSFASSMKLGLNFRVVTEKPLYEFVEQLEEPEQASGSADAPAASGSRKTRAKA